MRSRAKRQTVSFTVWVKPSVKEAYEHISTTEGVTLSQAGAAALEESLARRSHIQHRGIFQPMIEHAIAKEMRAYSSRIATLLVRILFICEQAKAIGYNNLRMQPRVTEDRLNAIMDGSKDTAKRNIGRED